MLKRFVSLSLLIFLLNACSIHAEDITNENNPDQIAETPVICSELPDELIADIFESSYKTMPVELLSEGADGCKYVSDEEINGNIKTINFIYRKTNSPEQTKSEYFRAVNTWQNSGLENREYSDIKNIGEKAFYAFSNATPQFIAYQNTNLVILTFGNFDQSSDIILEHAKLLSPYLLVLE